MADEVDFSQSVGLWYPAQFLSDYVYAPVPEMHSTIIFLGEIPDLEGITAQDILNAVSGIEFPYFVVDVIGTETFGPDRNVPVLLLDPTNLNVFHVMVEEALDKIGVHSASEFGYRPHVTVSEEIFRAPPSKVFLDKPRLWWGEETFEVEQ